MRHKEDKMQNARHGRLIGVSKRINAGRRNFLFSLSGQETLRLQICYCEIVTAEVSRQEVRVSVFIAILTMLSMINNLAFYVFFFMFINIEHLQVITDIISSVPTILLIDAMAQRTFQTVSHVLSSSTQAADC